MKPRESFSKRRFGTSIGDETTDSSSFTERAQGNSSSFFRSRLNLLPSTSSTVAHNSQRERQVSKSFLIYMSFHFRIIRRTASLPSSIYFGINDWNGCDKDSPSTSSQCTYASMLKKRSTNLGLNEQRELQGRITMTFREIDRVNLFGFESIGCFSFL